MTTWLNYALERIPILNRDCSQRVFHPSHCCYGGRAWALAPSLDR